MYCVVSYHGNKKSSSSLLMISYSCTINLTCTLLCVLDFNTLLKSNRSFSLSTAKHYFIACVSFWINVLPFFSFVVMGLQDFIIHIIKIVLCHKYFPNSSLCGCMIPTCIAVVALFPGPCRSRLHEECRGYNNEFYYSDVHTSHPADTMAYKSLIQKDIHLIISLHNNMLPNLITIRFSTTMVISSWSSVQEHTI